MRMDWNFARVKNKIMVLWKVILWHLRSSSSGVMTVHVMVDGVLLKQWFVGKCIERLIVSHSGSETKCGRTGIVTIFTSTLLSLQMQQLKNTSKRVILL